MSPATPSASTGGGAGGGHAIGMHSTSSASSFGNSGSLSALSSQIEPSPASTYGSSAASDAGIPSTPGNDGTYLSPLSIHYAYDIHRVLLTLHSSPSNVQHLIRLQHHVDCLRLHPCSSCT